MDEQPLAPLPQTTAATTPPPAPQAELQPVSVHHQAASHWTMIVAAIGVPVLAAMVVGGLLLLPGPNPSSTANPQTQPRHQRSSSRASVTPDSATAQTALAQAGKQTYHLTVNGVNREFIVYRPDNLPLDQAVPVVFMFHGSGETGELFYNTSGWKEKADAEGLVVVFPTALKFHVYADEKVVNGQVQDNVSQYQTKWNTFRLEEALDPNYPDQELQDDVAFTRAMVDFVKSKYTVDDTRFYATGFSNGGGFVERLMVEASDLFAAFAPSSPGQFTEDTLDSIHYTVQPDFTPRPTQVLFGNIDPKLTFGADVTEFDTGTEAMDTDNAVRTHYVDGFIDVLQLSDNYTYTADERTSHFTFAEPAAGSSSTAEYDVLIVQNMQHLYPNGVNFPITATDISWPFFEQYHL